MNTTKKYLPMVDTGNCSLTGREFFTSSEAAAYLSVSEDTLRNMASNGQVPYYKLGRRNRYRIEELRSLLSSKKIGGMYGK